MADVLGGEIPYNSMSLDLGGFYEVIRPGAFSRSLSSGADMICRQEHDSRMLLGRKSTGTLRVMDSPTSLTYEADMPDTQVGRDCATLVGRGDLKQTSFCFSIDDYENGERWSVMPNGELLRELLDVDICEVSPVAMPAYPATSVSMKQPAKEGE